MTLSGPLLIRPIPREFTPESLRGQPVGASRAGCVSTYYSKFPNLRQGTWALTYRTFQFSKNATHPDSFRMRAICFQIINFQPPG